MNQAQASWDRPKPVPPQPAATEAGRGFGPDDPQLTRALDEYLKAVEAGRQPEREEFLARYEELAEVLAKCLDGLDFIQKAAPQLRQSPADLPAAVADVGAQVQPGRALGDFRILREIGRGGMGVVYEAEQLSLGRRVALKVLPFASTLDAKQLQRFKNEAQAAAGLHHTNIVPVHATGCERGVHFYAMQFIEGHTLAVLIQELRLQEGRENRGSRMEDRGSNALGAGLPTPPKGPTEGLLQPTGPYAEDDHEAAQSSDQARDQREANTTIEEQACRSETLPTQPRSSILDSRSSPFFRTVAHLGIQAAEALEHAHQLGVIHRDIKPANLMVETCSPLAPGGRGDGGEGDRGEGADYSPLTTHHSLRLWITDFGLAHCQSQAGLTMSGDLVGTLRYMSPEQALAKRVLVDQRTDIYSLGVTLYELLTLEPAFPGTDRQEVLRQIAFDDPKPPRRLNKLIPAELETIVLKAMEKSPADRYATAQELADDLRRFLEDKPIRARRPTLFQRVRKLIRRHPGVAASAGLSLLLVLVLTSLGLTVNNLMIRQEQGRTKEANERLQDNLELSLKTLDEIYLNMLAVRLPRDTETVPENEELLTKGLDFYEKFAERNQTDPLVRRQVAYAYLRVSGLHDRLGQHEKARAALSRAVEVASRFSADFPTDPEATRLLAEVHRATALLIVGPRTAAREEFRKGIALLEPLVGNAALGQQYRRALARLHHDLAADFFGTSGAGNFAEAETHYREAIKLFGQLVDETDELLPRLHYMQALAGNLNDLALVSRADRRPDDAERQIGEQIRWLTRIDTEAGALPGYRRGCLPAVADFPPRYSIYADLASAHNNLGQVLRDQGRSRAAEKEYGQAIALWVRAAKDWPREIEFRRWQAHSRSNLAFILLDGGKFEDAGKQFGQALDLLRQLDVESPESPDIEGGELCDTLWRMGDLLRVTGDRDQAAEYYRKTQVLLEKGAKRFPDLPRNSMDLAGFLAFYPDWSFHDPARAVSVAQKAVALSPRSADCLITLGVAQYCHGQWQAAIASLEKANQLYRESDEAAWFFLAMAHWRLGHKEVAHACYDRGVKIMKKYEYLPEENSRWRAEAAALLQIQEANSHNKDTKDIKKKSLN